MPRPGDERGAQAHALVLELLNEPDLSLGQLDRYIQARICIALERIAEALMATKGF
jgi:hypothetical protein